MGTDQKREVEVVVPKYRVSVSHTAKAEVYLAVQRRSHTDRRIEDREAPARGARTFAVELEPLDVKLVAWLESPVEGHPCGGCAIIQPQVILRADFGPAATGRVEGERSTDTGKKPPRASLYFESNREPAALLCSEAASTVSVASPLTNTRIAVSAAFDRIFIREH